jgi:hypothetical protein
LNPFSSEGINLTYMLLPPQFLHLASLPVCVLDGAQIEPVSFCPTLHTQTLAQFRSKPLEPHPSKPLVFNSVNYLLTLYELK